MKKEKSVYRETNIHRTIFRQSDQSEYQEKIVKDYNQNFT